MRAIRFPMSLVMVAFAALSAPAEPLPCDDPGVLVEAADAETRGTICAAAAAVRGVIETCGVTLKAPITVETATSLRNALGPCLAVYDCTTETIRVIEPGLLRDRLAPDDPYAPLPDEEVFRSILAHEMGHALVEQNAGGRRIPPVDHEYIANALALAALSPKDRALLLEAAGMNPPISRGTINIFIYGIAPRRFAAAAYLYFDAHGCPTITGVLDGSFTFRSQR